MRSKEELQMDKAIMRIRDLAARTNSFTHDGIMCREAYRLVVKVEDMLEFLDQVEKHLDELDEMKAVYEPKRPNPDQLSLF